MFELFAAFPVHLPFCFTRNERMLLCILQVFFLFFYRELHGGLQNYCFRGHDVQSEDVTHLMHELCIVPKKSV